MKRARFEFLQRQIGLRDVLSAASILSLILMVIVFFSACETKKEQADSNSILRKGSSDHEIHGEVGAIYGQSASRH
jgi:hypothetical protein